MKKLSIILALAMLLTCTLGTTAFAAEPQATVAETVTVSETSTEGITPRGTLSGYGWHWCNAAEATSGSFYVNVTGSYWPYAQVTFNIEDFDSNTGVIVQLWHPDGTFAWGTADNSNGTQITMANKDEWHNLYFPYGQVGTYRVDYWIVSLNNTTPSSGRINCWIY